MGIREALEKNKNIIVVIVIVLIVGAVFVTVKNWRSEMGPHITNTFYSDNDGSSYYGGELKDLIPNQKKSIYRVMVFKNGEGDNKEFIGYLMRYSDASVKAIEAANAAAAGLRGSAKPGDTALLRAEEALTNARKAADENPEVKLPGPGHPWVAFNSPEGQKVVAVRCTNGKNQDAIPVSP